MTADEFVEASKFLVPAVLGIGILFVMVARRLKEKLAMHRKELIALWRRELLPANATPIILPTTSGEFAFMQLPAYKSLRPYLSKSFRERLEAERQIIQFIIEEGRVQGVVGDYPYKQLRDEIARVEREWNLD